MVLLGLFGELVVAGASHGERERKGSRTWEMMVRTEASPDLRGDVGGWLGVGSQREWVELGGGCVPSMVK